MVVSFFNNRLSYCAAALLAFVIICIVVASFLKDIKIAVAKFVAEGKAESTHIPAAVRVLVKIFGIVNSTPSAGIKDVVYIK